MNAERKPRRWPKRLLKAFLWTSGLLILLWTCTFAFATWELNRAIATLKARGEPTTFAEAVERSANKAVGSGFDFFAKAIAANDAAGRPGDAWAMSTKSLTLPIHADDVSVVEAELKKCARSLELIDDAIAQPTRSLTTAAEAAVGSSAGFHRAQDLRALARLLSMDAMYAASTGNPRIAFRRLESMYAISDHAAADEFVGSQLPRLSMLSVANGCARLIVPFADFTVDELTKLDDLLDRTERNLKLAPSLVNERALAATLFLTPERLAWELNSNINGGRATSTLSQKGSAFLESCWIQFVASPLGLPARRSAAAKALNVPTEVLDLIDKPQPWPQEDQVQFSVRTKDIELDGLGWSKIPGSGGGVLHSLAWRTRQSLAMLRLGVRLKRFHLIHGRLPEGLEEVCDAKMPELPTKWFLSLPLKYERDGYKLRIEAAEVLRRGFVSGRFDAQIAAGLLLVMELPSPKKAAP